ncbi:MAG: MFS transporter [Phycisphaeraceae bacterium]
MKRHRLSWLIIRLFLPLGLGYLVASLFRAINAVVGPRLIEDLGLTDSELGLVTATYLLTYALVQVPVGLLLDRFGVRRVEAALLLLAAVGAAVFGQSTTLAGLIVGRALIGVGVGACLMGAFKAFTEWLPPERRPFANGVHMVAGAVGMIAASEPVEIALGYMGWPALFLIIAAVTAGVAILFVLLVPSSPTRGEPETLGSLVAGVGRVLADRPFWAVAPWVITCQGAFIGLTTLWAGPWMQEVAGLDEKATARLLMGMYIAIAVGYFVSGALAHRANERRMHPMLVGAVGMALFALLLGVHAIGSAVPATLWIVTGFFGSFGILPYAVIPLGFDVSLSGRVVTSLNVLVFGSAFLVQSGFGVIVDGWSATAGTRAGGFSVALLVLAGLQAASILWFLARQHLVPRPSASATLEGAAAHD